MPYSAANLAMPSTSGGSVAGGGITSSLGGLPERADEALKARRLDHQQEPRLLGADVNVCGTSRGPYTNDPAGAVMTCPPTQKVSSPSIT